MDHGHENSLLREERLKHKKLFESLFTKGTRAFHYPVMALWSEVSLPEDVPIQIGFVAPKKHFKTAVQRNRVKRWLRESYRTQNGELESKIKSRSKQLAVLFMVVKNDNISFDQIRSKMMLLLQEIGEARHGK